MSDSVFSQYSRTLGFLIAGSRFCSNVLVKMDLRLTFTTHNLQ